MNGKVIPPHRNQDAWVYIRVHRIFDFVDKVGRLIGYKTPEQELFSEPTVLFNTELETIPAYDDNVSGSRVIASRKVENAVEVYEFIQRCEEEELPVSYWYGKWTINNSDWYPTLREAYYRYQNRA